jgi:hypothetical protein
MPKHRQRISNKQRVTLIVSRPAFTAVEQVVAHASDRP